MSLIKKLLITLRPLHDFRTLFLLSIAFLVGAGTDPAAILGPTGHLAYVIGMAGATPNEWKRMSLFSLTIGASWTLLHQP